MHKVRRQLLIIQQNQWDTVSTMPQYSDTAAGQVARTVLRTIPTKTSDTTAEQVVSRQR